ncbi:bifunctional DNA-formamidopyrimidine glycosylase/DNA-(apurinic or apyrimidinic site) lyase [Biformimicrobium ophioploci]|uniref:Formamidopyrimidine-DNA glycosylase n=1 Tax=Biformimicrobium ophioploci TaxID=3036711 RepID=A0ABQ6LVR8_9GAMM|nr:bifunctional DNA-formamidopyrimidine glycosylase/DNA-(apurinic or apyrimidinic site) lyase [Microbulbifer sp. NKW57]GMG86175.1 bifunctional DNA-formamidopyrimidine glycosylase/DNA-(apurinic or apyrimidinic site) lyase [Microbulbifer sp. NKW57]
MPELPEVETTCRGIAPHITGKTVQQVIVREPRLRWPVPADLAQVIEGQTLLSVSRRAKYLLLEFEYGHAIWHLGMSGSLRIVAADNPPMAHDHVDWLFDDGTVLRYRDPRRFGALLWCAGAPDQHELLRHLGPEPLSDAFSGDYLFQRSRGRKQAVKTFLMDGRIVVGVGNIYANEALFKAGIRPDRAAGRISSARYEHLAGQVKAVLARAIEQGGTTLQDFVGGDGEPGYFAQELLVYGRGGQKCVQCGSVLKETVLGQRATVFCGRCQR